MSFVRKIILYSLCIAGYSHGSFIVEVCPVEEVYPLQDFDTIFIIPDIQDDFYPMIEQDDNNKEIIKNDGNTHGDDTKILHNALEPIIVENNEDDITPVPHELINAVKKANKKKKKLEKKERKFFLKKTKSNK